MKFILFILFSPLCVLGQIEPHNFVTYDTTIALPQMGNPYGAPDTWIVRISRSMTDTFQRPVFIVMNGKGEQGSVAAATIGDTTYGPHYWLNHGWDGSVVLGNGVHYPMLITVDYTNNVEPNAPAYYNLLNFLINTYPIKRNSVHLAGLSEGAFAEGALIEFEETAGAMTGMGLIKSIVALEGTPDPLPAPYSTWSRGNTAFAVWAQKFGGRFFSLEGNGTDNFRNSFLQADTMNAVVPGSAYFSYEGLGGGAHCCWNSMYDPSEMNWTCVGTLGPNNAPSQIGQNTMGDYFAPSSIFQWMLRQGDTTLIGVVTPPPINQPPVVILSPSFDTLMLPTDSLTISENQSYDPDGTIMGCVWKQVSGAAATLTVNNSNLLLVSNLSTPGTYSFQVSLTDNAGAVSTGVATVTVLAAKTSLPPTAVIVGTTQVIGTSDTLTVIATDPNAGGKIIQWGWGKLSGAGTQTIAGANTSRAIITGLQSGAYSFKCTVWSSTGLTGSAIMNLNISRTITKVIIYYSDGTTITQQ